MPGGGLWVEKFHLMWFSFLDGVGTHMTNEPAMFGLLFCPAFLRAYDLALFGFELFLASAASRDRWVSTDYPLYVFTDGEVQFRSFRYLDPCDYFINVFRGLDDVIAAF